MRSDLTFNFRNIREPAVHSLTAGGRIQPDSDPEQDGMGLGWKDGGREERRDGRWMMKDGGSERRVSFYLQGTFLSSLMNRWQRCHTEASGLFALTLSLLMFGYWRKLFAVEDVILINANRFTDFKHVCKHFQLWKLLLVFIDAADFRAASQLAETC